MPPLAPRPLSRGAALRPLAALLLAVCLALSAAWPAPLRAEASRDEERARALGLGLAAVAAAVLVARAAERREDREEREMARAGRPDRVPGPVEVDRVLPAVCLRALPGSAEAPLLGLDCLGRRAGEAAAALPLDCVVTRPRGAGIETGFDPDCLAREGWRTG